MHYEGGLFIQDLREIRIPGPDEKKGWDSGKVKLNIAQDKGETKEKKAKDALKLIQLMHVMLNHGLLPGMNKFYK